MQVKFWSSHSDRTRVRIVVACTLVLLLVSFARFPSAARRAWAGNGALRGQYRGILVLFHGCSHSGNDWVRLPQDKRILGLAHTRKLFTLTPTALDPSGCWDGGSLVLNEDVGPVMASIRQARLRLGEDLPVYALGASSGGMFASLISSQGGFKGLSVIVSPGHAAMVSKAQAPTVFVHMTRDVKWATKDAVQINAQRLMDVGVRTAVFEAHPKLVSVKWLVEELDGAIQAANLREIVEGMIASNFLDKIGRLTQNPRVFCPYLQHVEPSLLPPLCEVLNMAWAEHEMTAEYFNQTLDFWGAA